MRRRVRRSWGLCGLLMTGALAGSAFAEEPKETDAGSQHSTEEQAPADQATPVLKAVPPAASEATAAAPAARPKVGDISTSGYFRGSFGASNQKGRMTCFKLALPGGLFSKYRLGNECEVWGEYNITTVVYAGDDGSVARLHFMPTAFIPTSIIGYSPNGAINTPSMYSGATGAVLYFPNLYVDLKGISWLGGGTAWLGTRYYKRESVYISDFFYWNPSGVGSGVEDIELGRDMRLSVAVFAVDGDPGNPSTASTPPLPLQLDFGARADVQLRGVKLWTGSELQLGLQYILDLSKDHPVGEESVHVTASGWGATLQYIQKFPRAIENKLAAQYGQGGGTGFGTLARFYYPDFSVTHKSAERRYRFVDVITLEPLRWLGAQLAFVYQRDSGGNDALNAKWFSGGGRLAVGALEHLKLLGELGYDRVKKDNGTIQELRKATGAIALTGGRGFMARPELRAFFTYALWNEAARTATVDSGGIYTPTEYLSGSIFGLQAEALW